MSSVTRAPSDLGTRVFSSFAVAYEHADARAEAREAFGGSQPQARGSARDEHGLARHRHLDVARIPAAPPSLVAQSGVAGGDSAVEEGVEE